MDLSEIKPCLYISGITAICEKTYLSVNIQKIISILGSQRELDEIKGFLSTSPYTVDHICILLEDGDGPIDEHFDSVTQHIKSSVENNIPTLIHCFAGVSRSVTLVAAYLCEAQSCNYNEALNYIKARRCVADPSFTFIIKLASRFPE